MVPRLQDNTTLYIEVLFLRCDFKTMTFMKISMDPNQANGSYTLGTKKYHSKLIIRQYCVLYVYQGGGELHPKKKSLYIMILFEVIDMTRVDRLIVIVSF
jgi:hypothetical protein